MNQWSMIHKLWSCSQILSPRRSLWTAKSKLIAPSRANESARNRQFQLKILSTPRLCSREAKKFQSLRIIRLTRSLFCRLYRLSLALKRRAPQDSSLLAIDRALIPPRGSLIRSSGRRLRSVSRPSPVSSRKPRCNSRIPGSRNHSRQNLG